LLVIQKSMASDFRKQHSCIFVDSREHNDASGKLFERLPKEETMMPHTSCCIRQVRYMQNVADMTRSHRVSGTKTNSTALKIEWQFHATDWMVMATWTFKPNGMQMHMRVALLWHLVSVSGIRNLVCGYGF